MYKVMMGYVFLLIANTQCFIQLVDLKLNARLTSKLSSLCKVSVCTESGEITPAIIQTLWKRFTLKITNTSTDESHAALKLLVMSATYV